MAQEWPIFVLLNTLNLQNRVAISRLPCGNCSWHTLTPKPCPGSVWRRVNWPVSKPSLTVQQCGHSSTGAWYGLPYWHRQNWNLLPHRWVSLGQENYGPFFFFFSAHKDKMAPPPHTHHGTLRPNVLSWMRLADLNPFELRKTLFRCSHCLLFWLVLLLWVFLIHINSVLRITQWTPSSLFIPVLP